MSKYNFAKDLKRGQDAEIAFLNHYPDLTIHEGRGYDFDRKDGARIELKADFYKPTGNFFIERWSSKEKEKPGSFWQSLDKADVFIYWFVTQHVYYEFHSIQRTATFLDSQFLLGKYKPIKLPHANFTGEGYKVPIKDLANYYREVRWETE